MRRQAATGYEDNSLATTFPALARGRLPDGHCRDELGDFPQEAVGTGGCVPVIVRAPGSQDRLLLSPSHRPHTPPQSGLSYSSLSIALPPLKLTYVLEEELCERV